MAILFYCPYCEVELEAPESFIGRSTACPDCEEKFTIPAVSKPAAERARTLVGGDTKKNGEYYR